MDVNLNVNVKFVGIEELVNGLLPAFIAAATAGKPKAANGADEATEAPKDEAVVSEAKPSRRGRPRKAKTEEPVVEEPVVEEPVVEEPVVEEPVVEEPVVEEPVVEEPVAQAEPTEEERKARLSDLRAACLKLGRLTDSARVLAAINSFGFKSLSAVPFEKYDDLEALLLAEIESAEKDAQ